MGIVSIFRQEIFTMSNLRSVVHKLKCLFLLRCCCYYCYCSCCCCCWGCSYCYGFLLLLWHICLMRLIWFCRCRCRDTARCSCMLCVCVSVCVLISLIRRVACNTRIEAYRTLNGLWRRRPLKARSEEWRTGNGPMAINIFKLRWAQHTLLSEEESRLSVLDSSSIVHAVQLTGCSPCSSWLLSHWRCGPSGVLAKV